MSKDYLQIINVNKTFPGVRALKDVSMTIRKGEIHALLGENGAGKSTLIKILGGVIGADSGKFFLEGKEIVIRTPIDSKKAGFIVMHQEVNLIPWLDVGTNISLGIETTKDFIGHINTAETYRKAKDILDLLNYPIDIYAKVKDLTFAQRQMVEIARAVIQEPKVVIMDEPSASLTNREREQLYKVITLLKTKGVSIIYITHLLDEVFKLSDRVTVLRDGEYIGTININEVDFPGLIKMMVGRELHYVERVCVAQDEEVLRVEKLNRKGVLENISFSLRKGEILGIAGLAGAGRTEIVRAIFGADKLDSGDIYIKGKKVRIQNPHEAFENGIAMVPEDRKTQGLLLDLTVEVNLVVSGIHKVINKIGRLSFKLIRSFAEKYIADLMITPPNPNRKVRNLSGGNQQKVAVGRCMHTDADILIIDEPTRGMDVGAKDEIHNILHNMAADGKSIIMISSEMPEILKMSDRILVIRDGRIVAELEKAEATQERILSYAMGGN